LTAQKHDYNWLIGGQCPASDGNPRFSLAQLDFNKNPHKISSLLNIDFRFFRTNISVSDDNGELQFYSNGNDIFNWQHEIMINGEQLLEEEECGDRGTVQGILSVPHPNKSNQYILFSGKTDFSQYAGQIVIVELLLDIVDMNQNNGEGEVILRNELLIDRDWWFFIFKHNSNEYYRILISDEGVNTSDLLSLDVEVQTGFGQFGFSPDGSLLGLVSNVSTFTGGFLYVFDVDRCDGILSSKFAYPFLPSGSGVAVGLAFSPNSRFMFVGLTDTLYQYDLNEQDLEESKVIVATENGTDNGVPFLTRFFTMQLAPDGKIYITKSFDNTYMHVIHEPDKKGLACEVELRGLEWPNAVHFSIPNNPNYRLGPLDGSSCDTLGIDNNPVANFIFEEEEP